VDEISRLRAVAVDGNRFSSERLVPEDADDATVVAPALTWAVYVEVAEGDCFRVVEVVVDLRISVDGPLVDTVGRGRGFGVRFRDGDCLRFTVDGGARGEDESEILLARVRGGAVLRRYSPRGRIRVLRRISRRSRRRPGGRRYQRRL